MLSCLSVYVLNSHFLFYMIDSCLTAKKVFQIGTHTVNCLISSVISYLKAKKKVAQ